ncbi:MAG: ABC transporter ATP-binding protein [Ktedonobacteraceae bacterium]
MRLPVKRYLSLLATYLKPQWGRTMLMTLLLLANVGLQLLNPQILRYFIDTALRGGPATSLIYAAVFFIAVALINQAVSVAAIYLSENVAWTATNQLRTDLVAHCLSLDMAFHKEHPAGELIERIDGDVDALSNFFSKFVVNLLSNALMVIGVLVLFFQISWLVGIVLTIFVTLAFVLLSTIWRLVLPLQLALRQVNADFSSFLGEHLVGMEDIRSNGATEAIMLRFYRLLQRWQPVNSKAEFVGYLTGSVLLLVFILGSALTLSLGAYLWSIGAVTVGTVYLMFTYTDHLSAPLEEIQTQLQDLQQAEACIQRIEALLHIQPTIVDGKAKTPLPMGALSVECRSVSFGYGENEPILHSLNFHLQAGNVLGIVGRTGSGKTTIARLLFRLYDPQQGEICIGGVPIRATSLHMLGQRIGIVTQDVQLFQASVRDNLTFFDRAIQDEQIVAALNDVGLSAWYHALPQGLDTELGSNGEGLSAGQAQLLAFTRVLLTNPGLVILDEAASRLDPATEYLIERATRKLFSGCTGIIIAHRLSTLQRVDKIMVLEDGRMLEYGNHADLANDPNSRFAHLLQTGLEEVSA